MGHMNDEAAMNIIVPIHFSAREEVYTDAEVYTCAGSSEKWACTPEGIYRPESVQLEVYTDPEVYTSAGASEKWAYTTERKFSGQCHGHQVRSRKLPFMPLDRLSFCGPSRSKTT